MIVDDEPFNLQGMLIILRSSMKKLGHNPDIIESLIDQANNGQEAVSLLALKHENYS